MTACYVIGDRPSHTHRRHWTGLGTRAQKDKQAKTCSCRFPHPPALPRFQSPPGLRHSRRPPFLDAHHVSNGRSRVSADFGFAPREAGPGTRRAALWGRKGSCATLGPTPPQLHAAIGWTFHCLTSSQSGRGWWPASFSRGHALHVASESAATLAHDVDLRRLAEP